MTDNSVQRGFFFALVFGVTFAFLWLIRGFLQPIFWAVALGILVYPVHARLCVRLRGRESLAALEPGLFKAQFGHTQLQMGAIKSGSCRALEALSNSN